MKNITNDIRYVGVNDHKIDLFEGQYVVPNGMAYNSYVILDEKISGSTILRRLSATESPTTSLCSTWSLTTAPTSSTL